MPDMAYLKVGDTSYKVKDITAQNGIGDINQEIRDLPQIRDAITTNTTNITQLQTATQDLPQIRDAITTNTTNITQLQTATQDLPQIRDAITTNTTNITQLQTATQDLPDLRQAVHQNTRDVGDLKSAINQTGDINAIPNNIEILDLLEAQVTYATSKGVTVTKTGRTKLKLNGTATASIVIDLDFYDHGIVEINARPLYFIIKRSDGIINASDVRFRLTYFKADGTTAISTNDKITMFNIVVPHSYASDAKYMRNYLVIESGASFSNVEFEFFALEEKPLTSIIKEGLLHERFSYIPLTFVSKTGYYARNGAFSTYSRIWGATVSIDPNKKYRISYKAFNGMSEVVYFDSSDNFISAITSHEDTDQYTYEFYPPANAAKLMIQAHGENSSAPSNNSELYGRTFLLVEDGTVIKENSPLYGKKIAYNGDSICESRLTGTSFNGGAFAYLISKATGGTYENLAVSGGTLSKAPSGSSTHSVSGTVHNMANDADLYCFEGGVNDFWNNVPLGDYSPTDYNATLDTTTVCGALEYIFRETIYYHTGKPIVFVFIHKATGTVNANGAGYTYDQMREKMLGICNKYAIPIYDAYTKSGLNGYNAQQNVKFLTANSTGLGDGIHPNKAAYIRYYVPQLIQLFESLILVNEE